MEQSQVRLSSVNGADLSWGFGLGRFMMAEQPRLLDYDGDGREDLFCANAVRKGLTPSDHLFPFWVSVRDDSLSRDRDPHGAPALRFPQLQDSARTPAGRGLGWILLHNLGAGWMEDAFSDSRNPFPAPGRGGIWLDPDSDGRPDLVLCDEEGEVVWIRRNPVTGADTARTEAARTTVVLRTSRANRFGVGAQVFLRTGGGARCATVKAGRSDLGAAQGEVTFVSNHPSEVIVRWPGGRWQRVGWRARGGQGRSMVIQEDRTKSRSEPPGWLKRLLRQSDTRRPPVQSRRSAAPPPPADTEAGLRRLPLLERSLREDPTDFGLGWEYIHACELYGLQDRSLAFFSGPSPAGAPFSWAVQMVLACNNVLRRPGIDAGRISWCAGRAVYELERLSLLYPPSWLVQYLRGFNLLYWPGFFGELGRAAESYEACLRLQQGRSESHLVEAYVGLGDARALQDNEDEARRIWGEGARRFPRSASLPGRLGLSPGQAKEFCLEVYKLERLPEARLPWIEEEIPYTPIEAERSAVSQDRDRNRSVGAGARLDVDAPAGMNLVDASGRLSRELRHAEEPGAPSPCEAALDSLSLEPEVKLLWRRGLCYQRYGYLPEHLKRAEADLARFCWAVSSHGASADSGFVGLLRRRILFDALTDEGDAAMKLGWWLEGVQLYVQARSMIAQDPRSRLRDLLPLSVDPALLWSQEFRSIARCSPE
jgi:hypothetical protein